VELPSQFMENWCYHRETLIGLSEHVETKEKLPDKFFEKILAVRTFRSASFMLRRLNFGVLDLELHHRHEPDSDEIGGRFGSRAPERRGEFRQGRRRGALARQACLSVAKLCPESDVQPIARDSFTAGCRGWLDAMRPRLHRSLP